MGRNSLKLALRFACPGPPSSFPSLPFFPLLAPIADAAPRNLPLVTYRRLRVPRTSSESKLLLADGKRASARGNASRRSIYPSFRVSFLVISPVHPFGDQLVTLVASPRLASPHPRARARFSTGLCRAENFLFEDLEILASNFPGGTRADGGGRNEEMTRRSAGKRNSVFPVSRGTRNKSQLAVIGSESRSTVDEDEFRGSAKRNRELPSEREPGSSTGGDISIDLTVGKGSRTGVVRRSDLGPGEGTGPAIHGPNIGTPYLFSKRSRAEPSPVQSSQSREKSRRGRSTDERGTKREDNARTGKGERERERVAKSRAEKGRSVERKKRREYRGRETGEERRRGEASRCTLVYVSRRIYIRRYVRNKASPLCSAAVRDSSRTRVPRLRRYGGRDFTRRWSWTSD